MATKRVVTQVRIKHTTLRGVFMQVQAKFTMSVEKRRAQIYLSVCWVNWGALIVKLKRSSYSWIIMYPIKSIKWKYGWQTTPNSFSFFCQFILRGWTRSSCCGYHAMKQWCVTINVATSGNYWVMWRGHGGSISIYRWFLVGYIVNISRINASEILWMILLMGSEFTKVKEHRRDCK